MNKKKNTRSILILLILGLFIITAAGAYALISPMSNNGKTNYVYIDADDNVDSVMNKLRPSSKGISLNVFSALTTYTGYGENIRTGRYAVSSTTSTLQTFRNFRNGMQSPISLVVPSVRTKERLAEELANHLMLDQEELLDAINDEEICKKYGMDTLTIQCLFIPNTYDVYWNVSVEKFLDRMKKEYDRFWTTERKNKAEAMGMKQQEVITLASIIDEETANNAEKPMVAGMYINRLKINMPLQADPTIKYAWRRFDLKRIYHKLLFIDSPYNTYRNTGLPPGPIRIPSIAGIDAVLNHVNHEYIYMCAKEDFSGTHNFAATYAEHLKNAKKYTDALNNRGIK
jgi:UPF0755 protein